MGRRNILVLFSFKLKDRPTNPRVAPISLSGILKDLRLTKDRMSGLVQEKEELARWIRSRQNPSNKGENSEKTPVESETQEDTQDIFSTSSRVYVPATLPPQGSKEGMTRLLISTYTLKYLLISRYYLVISWLTSRDATIARK